MKQAVIIVPIFILLLVILYLFTPVFPGKTTHESFIGQHVQVVVTQYDLEQRVEEFAHGPLGKVFHELDYELIGRELELPDEQIEQVLQIKEEIQKAFKDPLLNILFGSEASIAFFPFIPESSEPLEQQVLENILVISRPKHSARLMDFAGWFNTSEDRLTETRYGSHTIKRFELETGERISAVRVKELLVFGFNEQILRQSLDVYDGTEKKLLDDPEYREKIQTFSGASLTCYVNLKDLPEHVKNISESSYIVENGLHIEELDYLEGYKSGYFGAWRENDRIIDKALISFDKELLSKDSKVLLEHEPALPDSFKRVGEDTILYYWTNNFEPSVILEWFKQKQDDDGSRATNEFVSQLSQITGLPPETLVSLIDNDLTLAVKGISETQLVPLPVFLLSVKSSDLEQLRISLEKIIAHFDIPVRRTEIGGSELISWGGIIGIGSVLPSLMFADNQVILSSNRDQINEFLELKDLEKGLNQNNSFKKLEENLVKPSNSMTYLDFAETTQTIKEMVSWGGTMLALKDREMARKSKVLIDQLINPLLDGLAMYSIIGSRKYVEDDTILFESTTLIDNGKQ